MKYKQKVDRYKGFYIFKSEVEEAQQVIDEVIQAGNHICADCGIRIYHDAIMGEDGLYYHRDSNRCINEQVFTIEDMLNSRGG